jgi:hypothetical protein
VGDARDAAKSKKKKEITAAPPPPPWTVLPAPVPTGAGVGVDDRKRTGVHHEGGAYGEVGRVKRHRPPAVQRIGFVQGGAAQKAFAEGTVHL